MDIAIIIILLLILGIGIYICKHQKPDTSVLKTLVKGTFPNHLIIEKAGTIIICEPNQNNGPDERIYIRIVPNKEKHISQFGHIFKVEYPIIPSSKELKADFSKFLK